ncbi:beta-1,3-galactosyltransferase 1-like [Puntigrus tetrazona]|uniref:beta-1,3-galactosyltransferase 1-like n=1 Tax=Puntigrus tetrazona TaxID=1606681 RepID=UPI001C88F86C|nr:beta-1,3-galactosyltransferase 1-like [Puntigrus tetrazona]
MKGCQICGMDKHMSTVKSFRMPLEMDFVPVQLKRNINSFILFTLIFFTFVIFYNFELCLRPAKTEKLNNAVTPKSWMQTKATAAPAVTKQISLQYHVAHPLNYHFILNEPNKCSQWDPFLVFMVPVAPHQLEARNAIRSTWGNESSVQGKAVLTLFLVGLSGGAEAQQQLEEESRQHRDLLQSDFVDSYFNLTIKTMVIMDWLATHCLQATYAMKVDSDTFINLENLMTLLLAQNTPRENYITGFLMLNQNVVRNNKSKWYVSEELYPEQKYPTYVQGAGYVFSNDMPEKILEISKEVKPFNIEDAYVGACLKRLGFAPSSPPDPSQFKIRMGHYKREDFLKIISVMVGSPQQILKIWKDVKTKST